MWISTFDFLVPVSQERSPDLENRLAFQNVLHCNCIADYNCSLPLGAVLGVGLGFKG